MPNRRLYALYHRSKDSRLWNRVKRSDGVVPLPCYSKDRAVHIYQDHLLDSLTEPGELRLRPVPFGLS